MMQGDVRGDVSRGSIGEVMIGEPVGCAPSSARSTSLP